MTSRYQALGPLMAGEGSRAFLGLEFNDAGVADPVVIIWVPDAAEKDPALLEKIRRETEHASKLEHPNIVRVVGFASLDEGHARVVEYADGESLRRIIETAKKLSPRIAARLIIDACTGIHYAHLGGNDDGQPLVHGDFRPETLLVSYAGVPKVTGYGALAFAPREHGGQRVKGRRVHSAPEQIISGREAMTVTTDVYLLGLTLYECLTGTVPWGDQGDFFDHAVLTLPLPPASPGDVPPALDAIIQKACAKKAGERYANPFIMKEALEAAAGSEIASSDELKQFMAELFRDTAQIRADRRRTIDAGIAEYVRKQWAGGRMTLPGTMQAVQLPAETVAQPAPPPAVPVAPVAPKAVQAAPVARPAPSPADSLLEDDGPEEEPKGSSLPWILLLAVVVGVAAAWWGVQKANSPLTPVREDPYLPEPTPVAKVIDAGAPEAPAAVEVDAGAGPADAPVDSGSPEAAAVPTSTDTDAGVAAVTPAAGAAEDAGAVAGAVVEVPALIESQPYADLAVDDAPVGRTPWEGKLKTGKHLLRFTNKEIGLSMVRALFVKSEAVNAKYSFEQGAVGVNAPDGAVIFIDGVRKGTAPIKGEIPVFEGPHKIVVTVGESKWSENFTIYGAQRVNFNVELQ